MIEFVLDLAGDLAIAITHYEASDDRSQDIRAFMALYDSFKEIELKSERLITSVEDYTNAYPGASDFSHSRKMSRILSLSIYDLVTKFRKPGFRYLDKPFELFSPELTESFMTVGLIKHVSFRSLIEISAPDICFDKSIHTTEQSYFLRVLDYPKYGSSVAEVQKQWKTLLANCGISDILRQDKSFPILEDSGDNWMSEIRAYDSYQHEPFIFRRDQVQINESFIRSVFGFKILSFSDVDELKDQIQKDLMSLQRFRGIRGDLEAFLTTHFSMSDFF
jgi:hypothetical protein